MIICFSSSRISIWYLKLFFLIFWQNSESHLWFSYKVCLISWLIIWSASVFRDADFSSRMPDWWCFVCWHCMWKIDSLREGDVDFPSEWIYFCFWKVGGSTYDPGSLWSRRGLRFWNWIQFQILASPKARRAQRGPFSSLGPDLPFPVILLKALLSSNYLVRRHPCGESGPTC